MAFTSLAHSKKAFPAARNCHLPIDVFKPHKIELVSQPE
jgi:hypothetical protein